MPPRTLIPAILGFAALACSLAGAAETTVIYKSKYRIINIHRHCTQARQEFVRAELAAEDLAGVSAFVNLDVGSRELNLKEWVELRKKFGGRLILFFMLDARNSARPTFFDDAVRDLAYAASQGVQGVKVWKDLGMYARDHAGKLIAADDPRLDPFWRKCGELKLPVLMHTADEEEYWRPLTYNSYHYGTRQESDQHYRNSEIPKWDELIRQRDAVLERHPHTNFIGAHMGSQSLHLDQLGQTLERRPNFHVETAGRLRILGRLNPQAVRDFFVKYEDRILFGTDDLVLMKSVKPRNTANFTVYPRDDSIWELVDPADAEGVERWQRRAAENYSQYLQYFETERLDLYDPNHFATTWLRIPGIHLPDKTLEKLYYGNAARLIPGL